MREEWKPVVGFEDRYEVSNLGRIRRREVKARGCRGSTRILKARLLKPYIGSTGHAYIQLGGRGQRKQLIHRLVYSAFVGPIPPHHVVRHLDGEPRNNTPANLAIGTQAENLHDCYEYGRRMGCGKLDKTQVQEIRVLLKASMPQTQIAKEYGVTQPAISAIKTKKSFSYINEF